MTTAKFSLNALSEGTDSPVTENPVVITPSMLQLLVTQILTKVNQRVAERIVTEVTETSDALHVPSAITVFNLLKAIEPGMKATTVTGSISSVSSPNTQTLYLQKDNADDPTWTIYLYVDGNFVAIGDTSVDLVNYWSKSEADISNLRTKMLDTAGIALVKTGIDYEKILKSDDDGSKAIVKEWITEVGYLKTADFLTQLTANKSTVEGWVDDSIDEAKEDILGDVEKDYLKKSDFATTLAGQKETIEGWAEEKAEEVVEEALTGYIKTSEFGTKFSTELSQSANKATVDGWIDSKVSASEQKISGEVDDKLEDYLKTEEFGTELTKEKSTVDGWIDTKITASETKTGSAVDEKLKEYVKASEFSEKFNEEFANSDVGSMVDGKINTAKTGILSEVDTKISTAKNEVKGQIETELEDYVKDEEFGTKFSSELTTNKSTVDGWIDTKVNAAKNDVLNTVEGSYVKESDLEDKVNEILSGGDDDEGSLTDTIEGMIDEKVSASEEKIMGQVETDYLKKADLNSSLTVITQVQIEAAVAAAFSATDPFASSGSVGS